jgi:hypothetical protein
LSGGLGGGGTFVCHRLQLRHLVPPRRRREFYGIWVKTGPNEIGFFPAEPSEVNLALDGKIMVLKEVQKPSK